MLHIYFGDGKGKTSAGIGACIRALGQGKRILIIQFLKFGFSTGEAKFLSRRRGVTFRQFGQPGFVVDGKVSPALKALVQKGLDFSIREICCGKWDIVFLDELLVAVQFGIVDENEVITLIKKCPAKTELIITGRKCPPCIKKLGQYVTEFRKISHPFDNGEKARLGIEW